MAKILKTEYGTLTEFSGGCDYLELVGQTENSVFKFWFAICNDSSDSFLGCIIYSKYSSVFIKAYMKIGTKLK